MTYFIEILLVLEFQLTKTYFGTFSYKAHFRPQISSNGDVLNPTYVPISPITRGSHRQLPLRIAWGLTIHKAQGMTLQNVIIDIGNNDRQGLTFTAISGVASLLGL